MRVSISYPPIPSEKGIPLLAQNRQFQWFHSPTYIYPIIPAYAATILKEAGHEVGWHDGIAEEWTIERYFDELDKFRPDVVAIETKTPVVKYHWRIIEEVKERLPRSTVALMGDHVTALPEESMKESKVDYVLTGGDFDFLLRNLCSNLENGGTLEKGIWFRQNGGIANTGRFELNHELDELPFIDRDLTKWKLYSEKNGNYKRRPGTYTMVGRDCWWHRCTFCSWTTLFPKFRTRSPESLVEEIGHLIHDYGVREVFDDTGTFPAGNWLRRFCNLMIDSGYNDDIFFSCNMRFGAATLDDYQLMKKAGFRMLLFGVESADKTTLEKIDKNLTTEEIEESCKNAKRAGLEPHITIMFGYPWETKETARNTLDLGKYLLKKAYAETVQATIVIPYPGTPLFEQCREQGLLRTIDWDEYDMKKQIIITQIEDEELAELVKGIYKVAFDPEFLIRKVSSIRTLDDIRYMLNAMKKVVGHVQDYS